MPRRTLRLPGGRAVSLGAEMPSGVLIAVMAVLLAIVVISSAIGLQNEARTRDQAATATATASAVVATPTADGRP